MVPTKIISSSRQSLGDPRKTSMLVARLKVTTQFPGVWQTGSRNQLGDILLVYNIDAGRTFMGKATVQASYTTCATIAPDPLIRDDCTFYCKLIPNYDKLRVYYDFSNVTNLPDAVHPYYTAQPRMHLISNAPGFDSRTSTSFHLAQMAMTTCFPTTLVSHRSTRTASRTLQSSRRGCSGTSLTASSEPQGGRGGFSALTCVLILSRCAGPPQMCMPYKNVWSCGERPRAFKVLDT